MGPPPPHLYFSPAVNRFQSTRPAPSRFIPASPIYLDRYGRVISVPIIIGLIYEAASDLSLWPRLLEGMADYLGQSPLPEGIPDSRLDRIVANWFQGSALPMVASTSRGDEHALIASLAPHFVRAHELHRQLAEAEEERNLLEGLMNRLPLGMALVDAEGQAVSLNRAMLSLVRSGGPLQLEAGRLVSKPAPLLLDAIHQVISGSAADVALRLEDVSSRLSLWVSHMAVNQREGTPSRRVVVLAASQSARALSETGLCHLFGLTAAEARLTQQLALGHTLEEFAQTQSVSLNTAKTHLKRVFTKVGVRRQSELLQAVYSSPLWLDAPHQESPLPPSDTSDLTPFGGQKLQLADGRWLAYSDSGDPHGLPVIYMHGLAGSRHLRHPDDSILLENGIRLIIPERPGSGDSDPQPGRRIVDWPTDVAALADHLGIARFAVLGYSGGTPYALATARLLPQRVISVALAAAMPPIDGLDDLHNYAPTFRMSLLVARLTPSLLPPLLRVMVKSIRRNVYRYMETSLADSTQIDRQVFDDPRLRASYAAGLLAGVKRGEQDFTLEVLLAAHAWGFDPAEITCPVHLWHGENDPLVALSGARKLAARIPAATLETFAGAGHYVIYTHWREILSIRNA